MRKFNLEDYELVKKYEADFKRAVDSRYAKGITRDEFDEINRIYKETLNRYANNNCGGCVLQMLTSVGRLFFAFKKEYEEQLRIEEEQKKIEEQSQKPKTRSRRTSKKNKEDNKDGLCKDKIETEGSEGNPGDVPNN